MKAIVQDRFGPPDVFQLADVDVPQIEDDEILIKVHAASLNPYDWHMLRGDPYAARLAGEMGWTMPKNRVAGIDVAGRVEAVGAGVDDVKPGDEVFGFCPGAFAEYGRTKPALVVPKPSSLTFEQAAATPMAAVAAWRGLRDVADVQAGQQVLVNGAGGGIGTFAVQIATALGAEITGVCSSSKVELVGSLGAARVINYQRDDFTNMDDRYDVIFDNVSTHPLRDLRRTLTPTGTLVANGGGSPGRVFGALGAMLRLVAMNAVSSQRLRAVMPAVPNGPTQENLRSVLELVETGKVVPVIDRTYPLTDVADGLRHVESGHATGKAVVTI